jgi:hypothetical protein
MSDFKIGDRVVITGKTYGYQGCLKVGDTAHILDFYSREGKNVSAGMVSDKGADSCFHNLNNIELKPKWTIYNNDKPWSELSDKQKGRMLLTAHNQSEMSVDGYLELNPASILDSSIYKAIKYKAVETEPTMAGLFVSDWKEQESLYKKDVADHMIAKGWKK